MRIAKLLVPAFVLLAATATAAAAKEHPAGKKQAASAAEAAAADDNLLAVAAADGRFTQFLAAVAAAGLTEELQAEGPFTVFAPTDEAFAKLPEGMLDDLMEPANKARLAGLLANHVVPGSLLTADLITKKVTNVAGHELGLAVVGDVIQVDHANVVGAELVAGNGVIHAVDTVIVPAETEPLPQQDKPKDHPAH